MADMVLPDVMWMPAQGYGVTQVPSTVTWSAGTPTELSIEFGYPGDVNNNTWVFSRNLIRDAALHARAGLGDVQVRVNFGVLRLSLGNETRTVVLITEAAPLVNFVAQSYKRVSEDRELEYLPLTDDALAKWLGA
jgi:hypothetical protein